MIGAMKLERPMETRTRMREIAEVYEGPIPPAERAAARWGAGAWVRLTRGADAALIEARLRECVAALGRLRRSGDASGMGAGVLRRLAGAVAGYRRVSISLRAANGSAISR
jgi:hypothetical protein